MPRTGTGTSAPVLWFTGLSGSGKSTIATRVHQELERRGVEVEYIDGDALREVFPATGFTREEREEHLRRTGYMASRLAAHGVRPLVISQAEEGLRMGGIRLQYLFELANRRHGGLAHLRGCNGSPGAGDREAAKVTQADG